MAETPETTPIPDFETADPIKALDEKSIGTRSAACRDLSRMGTLAHLPRIAIAAAADPSPAVRLGAAAAASDILSRHRRSGHRRLRPDEVQAVVERFRKVDPALNPGVFSIFACLDLAAGLSRIRIALRDPRGEVRMGAAVGLMRLCISAARNGDTQLEADVVSILADKRHRPDATAEVARVCMASGYLTALPVLERLDLGGVHQETVDEAIRHLSSPIPDGWWASDGRDAGEVTDTPESPPESLATVGGAGFRLEGKEWASVDLHTQPVRFLFYRRVGAQAPAPALQVGETTYQLATNDELTAAIDTLVPPEAADWPHAGFSGPHREAVVGAIRPLLDDSAAGLRASGLLLGAIGDFGGAAEALAAALEHKKATPDTRYLLGLARYAAHDKAGAIEAWTETVERAKRKRDWFVEAAKSRLDA